MARRLVEELPNLSAWFGNSCHVLEQLSAEEYLPVWLLLLTGISPSFYQVREDHTAATW
jgi:hypothetical protein